MKYRFTRANIYSTMRRQMRRSRVYDPRTVVSNSMWSKSWRFLRERGMVYTHPEPWNNFNNEVRTYLEELDQYVQDGGSYSDALETLVEIMDRIRTTQRDGKRAMNNVDEVLSMIERSEMRGNPFPEFIGQDSVDSWWNALVKHRHKNVEFLEDVRRLYDDVHLYYLEALREPTFPSLVTREKATDDVLYF